MLARERQHEHVVIAVLAHLRSECDHPRAPLRALQRREHFGPCVAELLEGDRPDGVHRLAGSGRRTCGGRRSRLGLPRRAWGRGRLDLPRRTGRGGGRLGLPRRARGRGRFDLPGRTRGRGRLGAIGRRTAGGIGHGNAHGIAHADTALEPLDPGEGAALGVVGRRHQHAREHELEVEARRGGARHLGERLVHEVGDAGELGLAERRGLGGHAGQLVFGHAAEHGRGRLGRGRGDDDEVAESLEQVFDETARVLTGLHDPVGRRERARGVVRTDRVDDLVEQRGVRVAEQGDRTLVVDGRALGACDELVEQRQRVSRRTATGPDDEREHAGRDLDPLFGAELLHVLEHRPGRHEAERIVMRARPNGAEHLVGLGRREDELHVIGRLFDELQQRVEALRRHHVRLVEDEDLVAVACRREHGALAQVAGVVDAVVARRVDLDDVERAAAAPGELDAAGADAARDIRRAFSAVQTAREDARRGRLATAAWAAEEVGVIDPIGAERRHERLRHLGLADHLGECLGPVAAIEGGDHTSIVVVTSDTTAGCLGAYDARTEGSVMTVTTMTPAQLERFQARLLRERADAEERLAEFGDAMSVVRAAKSDGTADDEHDPEGPTMTQEWSQRTAVLADARAELADIDRALARVADGTYGICARCGKRIAVARLDARPTAELCIDCARLMR